MDKEFLFLAVVCSATLLIGLLGLAGVIVWDTTPVAYSNDYWEECDEGIVPGISHQADCRLRQRLIDANLWEDVNA